MTVIPAAPPVNFNLAVETLKRTLKLEKVAAAVLSKAQDPPSQAGQEVEVAGVSPDSVRGQNVNTDA